jgi:digeranylgeranylglycerophospholipid reductase
MREDYELVVVGGGLAGLSAAITASKNVSTLMVFPELAKALPVEAPPGLDALGAGPKTLDAFEKVAGCQAPMYIETYGRRYISPGGGTIIEQISEKPVGGVLMTSEMMSVLFKKALLSGAEYEKSRVIDFIKQKGKVSGVVLENGEEISSKMVICACGYNPELIRKLGAKPPEKFVKVLETMVDSSKPLQPIYSFIFGRRWTDSLNAYTLPVSPTRFKLSVAVTPTAEPFEYLKRIIETHPAILEMEWTSKDTNTGLVPITPSEKTYGDGYIIVGDAAGHFQPIGGVGTRNAIGFGKIAGEEASKAIAEGDTSDKRLRRYEEQWKQDPAGQKLIKSLQISEYLQSRKLKDTEVEKIFETLQSKPITEDFYIEMQKQLK